MPELIPAEPLTPEWHAARRLGVTATDIPKILGMVSKTAYWLYWNKLGQVPDEPDSDRFRLGRELEPYIAARWQEATGINPLPGALYRHSVRAWQMATTDYAWHDGRPPFEPALLEVKTWADADRHSWSDAPPAAVRAQVLWQMDVMDVPVGHVGVVFLPSGEFRSYTIEHAEHRVKDWCGCAACDDLILMRERGAEFYARLQGELPPPDIDASAASLAAVKARFGDVRKDKTVSVDVDLWSHYSAAVLMLDAHAQLKREYENKLREQIGEAGAIEMNGELVARRLVYDSPVKAHNRHVDSIRRVGGRQSEVAKAIVHERLKHG